MSSVDFHIVACTFIYTFLNAPLPRLSLYTIAFLQWKLLLVRETARRGKRWLPNRRYVRRGQPTVNFEICALWLF